jgi:hypothetical protein
MSAFERPDVAKEYTFGLEYEASLDRRLRRTQLHVASIYILLYATDAEDVNNQVVKMPVKLDFVTAENRKKFYGVGLSFLTADYTNVAPPYHIKTIFQDGFWVNTGDFTETDQVEITGGYLLNTNYGRGNDPDWLLEEDEPQNLDLLGV